MIKIGIVILTWNSEKCIYNCLSSIFSLDVRRFCGQIFIIDNGSTDRTVEQINKATTYYDGKSAFTCKLRNLKQNCGTTKSRNIGLKYLIGEDIDYICVLDSDTVVNTDAMLTLAKILDIDCTIGIIGPRMKDKKSVYQHSGRNLPTLTEKLYKVLPIKILQEKGECMERSIKDKGCGYVSVGYLMSACWMMRKEFMIEIGLFDEKIFYAPEDVDYCIRCQKAGYSVKYCYDAEIIHEWQRISRKKLFSYHNFEHVKGLIYLFWKHGYMFSTAKLEYEFKQKKAQRISSLSTHDF